MTIEKVINNLLNGASPEEEVDALVEKRVCYNRGPRVRRKTKRGRVYYVRERVCRGKPNPAASRRAKRSLIGKSAQRRRSQRMRWRH